MQNKEYSDAVSWHIIVDGKPNIGFIFLIFFSGNFSESRSLDSCLFFNAFRLPIGRLFKMYYIWSNSIPVDYELVLEKYLK